MNEWLKISKKLQKGEKKILCPFCGNGILEITKVKQPSNDKYDVYVKCPECKQHVTFSGAD